MVITLPHARIELAGALDLEHTADGVIPRRLPRWTVPQIPREMHRGVRGSSGVRLRLAPTGPGVRIRLRCAVYHPGSAPPQRLTLVGRGHCVSASLPTAGILTADGVPHPSTGFHTVAFEAPPGEGPLELWLPPGGICEIAGLSVDGELAPVPPDPRPRWWHYGSSISQCSGAREPLATWPAQTALRLGLNLTNLGFGGQALLDPFVARTMRDSDADILSLEVGVNIQNTASLTARTFAPALHGFLDALRERHPRTPVLVITPILFPAGERRPGPVAFTGRGKARPMGDVREVRHGALSIGAIRRLIPEVLEARADPQDVFVDGRLLLGIPDARHLSDGLHPGPAGYLLMAERFSAIARRILAISHRPR